MHRQPAPKSVGGETLSDSLCSRDGFVADAHLKLTGAGGHVRRSGGAWVTTHNDAAEACRQRFSHAPYSEFCRQHLNAPRSPTLTPVIATVRTQWRPAGRFRWPPTTGY